MQVRHICKAIEVAGFNDADCNNIINTKDGTAYFIDTEAESFVDVKDLAQWPPEQKALSFDSFKETTEMTDAATAYLSRKITKSNTTTC